jgi:NAD(P)-dependent dehydrogenase (short-subunit alcohol dehydrogenase family)
MEEPSVTTLPRGLAAFDLKGRVAVITGASSGIGRSFAGAIVDAGGKAVVVARREDRLKDLVLQLGPDKVAPVICDVGDHQALPAMALAANKAFGAPDIVVNVAGNTVRKQAEDLSPDEFLEVIKVQLMAPLHVAQQFVPAMKEKGWGRVVNIGSITTSHALPGTTAYAACKSGISGLTRAMAKDWGPFGITVNALCPGFFATELTAPVVADEKRWKANAERTFVGRNGVTEDMHGALVMLCSEAGRYISGQMLYVDAGFTAN